MTGGTTLDRNLFRYVWRHSRRDQLVIFAVVLASLPFYYWSLDLPKRIVNDAIQGGAFKSGSPTANFLEMHLTLPQFLGGGRIAIHDGFEVGQLGLLLGLSFLFLFFVLVNGAFKYWINVAKGALGERMLRRMRFDLFCIALRFTPETQKTVKSSETATMIKDEVEPIGGFIGDAFSQPLLLGSQAITAMTFIVMQNVWLGLIAACIIAVQFTVIPRLRRVQLRLGKQRQILSRRLAGKVSEVVDDLEAVHDNAAVAYERAGVGERLYTLFDLRFRIYKWKFMVKFLNNLLAQITPFFFYAVGGYFALKGSLDIGQLVAVIAAYRDLPPPLKELIDWDQQRLDVQIKYDQVVQQFSPEKLLPEELLQPLPPGVEPAPLPGPVEVKGLHVVDSHGVTLLEQLSFRSGLPLRVALIASGGAAPSALAQVLGRRITEYRGQVLFGGEDLARMPEALAGRRIAYAGPEPVLFAGTLRDNLVYGLRRRVKDAPLLTGVRRAEALATGNPLEPPDVGWLDVSIAGCATVEELDQKLIGVLEIVGLRESLLRLGLWGLVDVDRYPGLAGRVVEARKRLRQLMAERGLSGLIEPFDFGRYNAQATVAENLLFGVPVRPEFRGEALAHNPLAAKALEEAGALTRLRDMGAHIAVTMAELFRDLPPGHPLFEQFSFVPADELEDYEEIVARWRMRGAGGLNREERDRLLALTLDYIEPKHRLGLLDDSLRAALVQARRILHARLQSGRWAGAVEFYHPDRLTLNAPLRNNLAFGRMSHTVADAAQRVADLTTGMLEELGLRLDVERVGLDYDVGPAGRLLPAQQRMAVYIARGLVKNPDLLVLDGVFSAFGETQARAMIRDISRYMAGRSVVAVLHSQELADPEAFDLVVAFEGPRPVVLRGAARLPEPAGEVTAGGACGAREGAA
ncbi:ABC transporter transmembrane domain-containing protein [Camelimonas abortus]|uniref:ABC transporter transmembrane domain-containing protein n=1 Tax=Camelimonas abortus TaxID=1017184 RepID=UPI0035EBA08C